MQFLKETDFRSIIRDNVLDDVIHSDKTLLEDGEAKALAEMQSYLNINYDVSSIFSKSGNSRSQVIIMYLVDMVLYHLHSRINPRQIPDIRSERYEQAIDWLKKVSRGQLAPDLPERAAESNNIIQHGSRKKRNNYF